MTREYYLKHKKELLAKAKIRRAKRGYWKEEWKRTGRVAYLRKKANGTLWKASPEQQKEQSRKYKEKHPIKRKRTCNNWYHRNKKEVRKRAKEKYWKDVNKSRKQEREKAKKQYWKHPIKSRRRIRKYRESHRELLNESSGWSQFKKRYGLNLAKGKEDYLWLRKLRIEHSQIRKQWKDGVISQTELLRHLQQLELRMQSKSSIKTQRR
jgi:hypothetical protein